MNGQRRVLTGTVTSDKMDKTVVVQVERSYRHPLYGKVVRSHRKYVAHDEDNQCRLGDTVSIRESRPLSKTKRWVVEQILSREALPEE
ncbi:MAG: 30S ribosomal protein S17 [Anaerolineae bacterium]|nr:30S ribosomal protein S17 [Anaerolineae bacterium]